MTTTTITSPSEMLAAEIRAEIARQGVQKNELAIQLGVSHMWLSRRIGRRPEVPLTLEDIVKLAEALNVSVQGLVGPLLPRLDSNQQPSGYRSLQVSGPLTVAEPVELQRCPRCGGWMLGACPWCATAVRDAYDLAA